MLTAVKCLWNIFHANWTHALYCIELLFYWKKITVATTCIPMAVAATSSAVAIQWRYLNPAVIAMQLRSKDTSYVYKTIWENPVIGGKLNWQREQEMARPLFNGLTGWLTFPPLSCCKATLINISVSHPLLASDYFQLSEFHYSVFFYYFPVILAYCCSFMCEAVTTELMC